MLASGYQGKESMVIAIHSHFSERFMAPTCKLRHIDGKSNEVADNLAKERIDRSVLHLLIYH